MFDATDHGRLANDGKVENEEGVFVLMNVVGAVLTASIDANLICCSMTFDGY